MKKKIINGILMSALLLAGTTSFVSCKDNVDDVENGIRKDMETLRSGLQTKIDGLESRVGILEANQVSVDQLNQAINNLRTEINTALNDKADKSYVDAEVKRLEGLIGELTDKINKLSQTMVTGVVLQETLDCVVGTINLPGFNPAILAAYVGERKTNMYEFPIAGKDCNVDPDGNYLLASELPRDINGNIDEDAIIGNSGKNAYLINGTGNAGTLYFTINPRKVDPTLLNFDLINSRGEETGITLSDVKKSDHLITWAIGKHGNGLTRAEGDATDSLLIAPAPGVNVENEKTYLYEAKATVALDAIEKMHFDYTKFGYQNVWDAGSALMGVDQGPDAEAQNVFGRFQYLANELKQRHFRNALKSSLKIIQDFYNGVYSQRQKLQKSAVRVSWDDGENDVISGFDITTVTINPLNYKQMILADQLLSGASWNIMDFDAIASKIVSKIQSKMPKVTYPFTINLFPSGTKIDVYPAKDFTYTDAATGTTTTIIKTTDKLATVDVGQVINTAAITSLQDQVNALLQPYNNLKNATTTGVMTRVNNYLNKVTEKFIGLFDYQPCWKLTEPTLLFESREGINRMYPFGDADGSMRFAAGKYTFIMTSLTEEYIVPVYRKYIALIYGGKVKQYYSLPGNEKIAQFDIPNEACEIVYQTSDYYGNVVTKRYPINRK